MFIAEYSNLILSILFSLLHAKEMYLLCHLCSIPFCVSHSLLVGSLKTSKKPLQVAHYSEGFFLVHFLFLKIYFPSAFQALYKERGTENFCTIVLAKVLLSEQIKKIELQIYQEAPSNQTIFISLKVFQKLTIRDSIKNFKTHFLQHLILNTSCLIVTISGCFRA